MLLLDVVGLTCFFFAFAVASYSSTHTGKYEAAKADEGRRWEEIFFA